MYLDQNLAELLLVFTMTDWVKICKTEGAQPVSIVCHCYLFGFLAT